MDLFTTSVSLEPCVIVSVDPARMTATVNGLKNIGHGVELSWLDYSNPGQFGSNDSHWGGRVPEKGSHVLVLAEWTPGHKNLFVRGYIVGYLPVPSIDFAKDGYSSYRNKQHEPLLEGDAVTNTSSKSLYKVSSSGTITEETTPRNYRRRSPEDNTTYDISENSHIHVSGFAQHILYSDSYGKATRLVRAIWNRIPKTEYRSEAERTAALSDKDNTVVLEEMGKPVPSDFIFSDAGLNPPSLNNIVYKLSIITDGKPVYTKTIDSAGNVYEATASNFYTLVSDTAYTAARLLRYSFGAVAGAFLGVGSGVCDFIANKVNFRRS